MAMTDTVLIERIGPCEGAALWAKRAAALILGVAAMAVLAKAKVPMWPSPVPINLGTFGVLVIGAAYGWRLGLATMLAYLAVGAIGFDVFASSTAENNGLAYMLGSTGGYLAGYLVAVVILGMASRAGWDRKVVKSLVAMIAASAAIYALGVPWLHQWIGASGLYDADAFATPLAQTFAWGLTPYLIGDAIKLALAALLIPAVWKLLGDARG